MEKKFLDYLSANGLLTEEDKILVAVSGGIDSMVLAHLYLASGIKPAIAHCNFTLRDADSDGDEAFVRSFAGEHTLTFHTIRFNTSAYASSQGISVEMAARELRYQWFAELLSEHSYDVVAVAHNLNDNVETFFINLLRSTGINGLTGMKPRNGNVIRPLLFATRDEITAYAVARQISFREDYTNAQDIYVRNKIRHKIIPCLREVNPDALSAISSTMKHLTGSAEIINNVVDDISRDLFTASGDEIHVSIEKLLSLKPERSYLFELFRRYGLSPHQTEELQDFISGPVGRILYTASHRVIRDRNDLIITTISAEAVLPAVFGTFKELSESGRFSSVTVADASSVRPGADPKTAFLDAGLISYPLTYRLWEQGDRFSPLGMTNKKKVSDFLVDNKISRAAKEKIMVLASGEDIIWIAGLRIDNNYKVTGSTTRVLIISL